MPFGGGYSLGPGRHVAKEEIVLTVAMLTLAFDFKLINEEGLWSSFSNKIRITGVAGPEHDMRYLGMGILPPRKQVKMRCSRRV